MSSLSYKTYKDLSMIKILILFVIVFIWEVYFGKNK